MKILTIFNDEDVQKQNQIEIIDDLGNENEVEVISLKEGSYNYDEIVNKIEECDKLISW